MTDFVAPFPYFGGKASIAPTIWQRLGAGVTNYVEPFAGSAAMLLKRPGWSPDTGWIETINDASGFVSNFWRALQAAPDEIARWADWPVNENDLHARHAWLVQNHADALPALLEGDPNYYDSQVAGWWVWGMACWIGGGFCSGNGPWQSIEDDDGQRRLVHLGDMGRGVARQLVHLGDMGRGVARQLVHLGNMGQGVARQRVHLGDASQDKRGTGEAGLLEWMRLLSERLRRVRVCCGDWSRVCGPTPTVKQGTTAVFLDPPYSAEAGREDDIYEIDDTAVAHVCRAWSLEWGNDPRMRIALCGYRGEHDTEMLAAGWDALNWKAQGGYGLQGNGKGRANSMHEVVWFSPHCLNPEHILQMEMFG